MGVGFIPALPGTFCQGDSVIDACERLFDLARFCFRLCKGLSKLMLLRQHPDRTGMGLTVALGIVSLQRLPKMRLRRDKITLKDA